MLKAKIFGKGAKLHHIGLAVKSIPREAKQMGLKPPKIYADKIQKVKVAFIELDGAPIELIEPLSESSPINLSLKKNQVLVHLCFIVSDLEKAVAQARGFGFRPITKPVGATAFEDRQIVWLFSTSLGLVELVEKSK